MPNKEPKTESQVNDWVDTTFRSLIGLNSPKHLKIKKAFITSSDGDSTIDVTDTLDAQFDDEEPFEHVIPFCIDTEYLLCDMCN